MENDFKQKLIKRALELGFEDCEIYYSSNNSFQVKIFKGEIAEFKNTDLKGVSFRGTYDGKMAYSYSEKISNDVIDIIINTAIENSKVINEVEQQILYKGDKNYPVVKTYHEGIDNITVEDKINKAKEMESAAYKFDSRVKSVDHCVVSTASSEVSIYNSLGLDLNEKSNYCIAYIYSRVEDNGQTKLDADFFNGVDWKDFDPFKVGENSVKKALKQLGATSLSSGKYKAVFENDAFIDFLSTFEGVFHADSVQKGFSLLKDKIGLKIASDIITIRDDATLENCLGSTSFDSEGVATENTLVVENGILKTFLHNLKTAKIDGVKSTGNGFKSSFKSVVDVLPTNFYIEPGTNSYEALLKKANNGIVISSLSGLHSGANQTSGDFSLLASGFIIENGEITKPIEQFTISGNFFELLNNIVEIGSDLSFQIGSIGSPSIFVDCVNVAGDNK